MVIKEIGVVVTSEALLWLLSGLFPVLKDANKVSRMWIDGPTNKLFIACDSDADWVVTKYENGSTVIRQYIGRMEVLEASPQESDREW